VDGLNIIARSMSVATRGSPTGKAFQFGNAWQYHPRSDRHSKVACWALMFDLIEDCSLLRSHLEAGKVAIGINHTMRDFARDREKNLDLVVCRAATVVTRRADQPMSGRPQSIVLTARIALGAHRPIGDRAILDMPGVPQSALN
jgi:hypothetical protein